MLVAFPKSSNLVCMDVNLKLFLKMTPEMSKIAIYFFPVSCSHKTQAFELNNKRRYNSFASISWHTIEQIF